MNKKHLEKLARAYFVAMALFVSRNGYAQSVNHPQTNSDIPYASACLELKIDPNFIFPASVFPAAPHLDVLSLDFINKEALNPGSNSDKAGALVKKLSDGRFEVSLWSERGGKRHQVQASPFLTTYPEDSARRLCYALRAVPTTPMCPRNSKAAGGQASESSVAAGASESGVAKPAPVGAVEITLEAETFPKTSANLSFVLYACDDDLEASKE